MKNIASLVLFFCSLFSGFYVQAQLGIITTIAGNGTGGYSGDGGAATAAKLNLPTGVAIDGLGNIYIADNVNNRIRKVNNSGIITTIAGNGSIGYSGDGGLATTAKLYSPTGIAIDSIGNIYIADQYNQRIRKVNTSGIISTIAGNGTAGFSGDGGDATAAKFCYPTDVAIDVFGNVYIVDQYNARVRKVNSSGIITTFAGSGFGGYSGDGGAATAAELMLPRSIATDRSGNVYIADFHNNNIRKVNSSGIISTIAGNGIGGYSGDGGDATSAEINKPYGVTIDGRNNIYIADYGNNRVRKVSSSGVISTVAGIGTGSFSGDGGAATSAELDSPSYVTSDESGNVYIADNYNNRIRRLGLGIPEAFTDSFSVYITNTCTGLNFWLNSKHYSAGQHIITYFGNKN